MELIKVEDVLAKANEKYIDSKIKKGLHDPRYCPPECRPQIQSDQIKALAAVLVDEINQAIEDLRNEIFTRISERASTCASLGAESMEPR